MHEICRQLGIKQEFTPSFVHHCLGACERTHKTIAERLTPYVQNNTATWIDALSCVTFSINQSVNSGSGFSPHEIIFGQRPKFPLSPSPPVDFETIPVDVQSYVRTHAEKLNSIRSEVKNNIKKSQEKMTERANSKMHSLKISPGDYVYLLSEAKGVGQKLQNKYTGPFLIDSVLSPHMVIIRNPENGQLHKNPVHMNRLKMAYIRSPEPKGYFRESVKSCEFENSQAVLDSSESIKAKTGTRNPPIMRKSTRNRKPPDRFGVYVDPRDLSEDGIMTDRATYYKIKRVLGQRGQGENREYLVQFSGEPAENAIWLPFTNLNHKLKQSVLNKPPPVIG